MLCGWVEPLLHDSCGVNDAVQAAVAAAVGAMAFFVGGVDRDRGATGVASEFGRAGEAGDVADLSDEDGCRDVTDPDDLQECQRVTSFRIVVLRSRTR